MPLIEELADASAPGEEHAPSALTPLERRVEKEWEDQLALAKEQEAGADVSDVPVRDLYGEQSVHNYPDVHNDWGDGAHAPLSADATGWNTAYRAQLEHAMAIVRDSNDALRGLKKVREVRRDIDEGVELGEARGRTAEEALAEFELDRAEAAARVARRRRASLEAEAAEREASLSRVEGLRELPDFITARAKELRERREAIEARGGRPFGEELTGAGRVEGADASPAVDEARLGRSKSTNEADASSPLADAHREWLAALGEARGAPTEKAETIGETHDEGGEREGTDAGEAGGGPRAGTADASFAESLPTGDDSPETSFFENLTHMSPLKRAAAGRTEEADFWNRDVYGAEDGLEVDDELEAFEAEMAKLCAAEVADARRESAGGPRAGGAEE